MPDLDRVQATPEKGFQPLTEDEVRFLQEFDRPEQPVRLSPISPDRRRDRRQPFTATLTARLRQSPSGLLDPPVTVQGRDLSLKGMQFASPIEFPTGAELELFFQLRLWGNRRFVRMLAEVRHCNADELGQWIIGCMFLDTLAAWPN